MVIGSKRRNTRNTHLIVGSRDPSKVYRFCFNFIYDFEITQLTEVEILLSIFYNSNVYNKA